MIMKQHLGVLVLLILLMNCMALTCPTLYVKKDEAIIPTGAGVLFWVLFEIAFWTIKYCWFM